MRACVLACVRVCVHTSVCVLARARAPAVRDRDRDRKNKRTNFTYIFSNSWDQTVNVVLASFLLEDFDSGPTLRSEVRFISREILIDTNENNGIDKPRAGELDQEMKGSKEKAEKQVINHTTSHSKALETRQTAADEDLSLIHISEPTRLR